MIVGLYAWKIHKRIKSAEETIAKKHVLYINGGIDAIHQFKSASTRTRTIPLKSNYGDMQHLLQIC